MNRLHLFLPRFLAASAILVIIHMPCLGQRDTTIKYVNERPNIVKLSISSWLLYSSSFHMG
ncbi:MAG TPA: hypothetical protein VFI33_00110, partial [Puia sp.]|nr:hypothetical protein [Puia sp.]